MKTHLSNTRTHQPTTIKTFKSSTSIVPQSFKAHSDQQNRESGFGLMGGSSKKLSEIIEKWRKRKKGHFVVYTKEGKRFVVPLYYLNHPIFKVLLEMAEEEFGSTVHGPLQVPCEEELMDYILSLLRKNASPEVEDALVSMASCKGASVSTLLPLFHSHEGEQDTVVL